MTAREKIEVLQNLLEIEQERGEGLRVFRPLVSDLSVRIRLLEEGIDSERERILDLIGVCLSDVRKELRVRETDRFEKWIYWALQGKEIILEYLTERIKKE